MARKINHHNDRGYSRKSGIRNVKKSFLIITEGINTEPEYFNAFRLTSATVRALGQGMSTVSLVRKAMKIRDGYKSRGKSFDQYWVVFDKDDNSDKDFNDAITLAQKNGFRVAYSNQAFEYWLLLHFGKYQGHYDRKKLNEMLGNLIGSAYTKRSGVAAGLYNLLLKDQPVAIANAKSVYKSISKGNPAKEESSTLVFELVEELNKYL